MKSIFKREKIDKLKEYLRDINGENICLNGLSGSAKSFIISSTVTKGINLVVFNSREEATGAVNDLYHLMEESNIFYFPTSDNKNMRSGMKDASMKVQRTATISSINDYINNNSGSDYLVIVTYKDSIEEAIVNNTVLNNSIIDIKVGDRLSHDYIKEALIEYGFERKDFVSQPGDFAFRGSLIDIYPYNDNIPYRLDFFGDEIESIKTFNINTQRSIDSVDSISVYANIIDNFSQDEGVSIFEFLPKESVVWLNEGDLIEKEISNKVVYLSPLSSIECDKIIDFNTIPQPTFNKQFDIIANDIKNKDLQGYEVYIMSESDKQIERLKNILYNYRLNIKFINFTINEGFIDKDSLTCLYTDHQIFDRFRRLKLKRTVERSERLTMNDINSFREGDYIVHIDHGVGRFGGLVKNNINGKIQEAVKLIYRDNDIIFVSLHGLHRISKYRSADMAAPKIYKLGTNAWKKLKDQTKSKVKDIAADLIKLYSQRRVAKGFAFSEDSYLQYELESSFKYEETPDQNKAVAAVKEDMEKSYPMDRLVCGDVGFGKTEVAIRAAFKAVNDSKQVAVLVPTTILALQHYNTFKERMKDLPCEIDYISRLRTKKEVADISSRLKEGRLDIIIGTHKLLNKELQYKDLGLLIIDEEQKFGVSAKERLKQLKLSVDTLTLSATPIPRTLQFSLLGARDLSIINTPPPNRQPIQTEIIDFNEELVTDIINYEIDRGGQIFFIHNKIEDIESIADILKRLVPKIKICVAHGQMDPKVIESKILDYMAGDYDLLLSTTIVENGIDIPNTNTIIINKAQNFGLSDLHQLRGRVGRSNKKAFCYLIVPPFISLSDDAKRRLKAIEAFSDLGSGFNIAMQDLDIRGMGNMLGAEQSGYIADMGFETYQRILAEAFEEIKSENRDVFEKEEEKVYVSDCVIDTDLEMMLPDSYISVTSERIRIYKELDNITEDNKLDAFIEEMIDRYGKMPEELLQLTFVVRLRIEAIKRGFEKVVLKNEKMLLYFISKNDSEYFNSENFASILAYIQTKGGRYRMKEKGDKLYIAIDDVKTVQGAYNLIKKM